MSWLRHRIPVIAGVLAVGTLLVFLGGYHKLGYVDRVATAARATDEGRFDNRDLDRAARNLFASEDLVAYNQGVRAYAAGRFDLAVRHFREAIDRGQSTALRAKAYYNLGNLLALGGNARGAVEMYREALRLDPSDWDAKSNLEVLYSKAGVSEGEGATAGLKQTREPGESGDETGPGGRGPEPGGI